MSKIVETRILDQVSSMDIVSHFDLVSLHIYSSDSLGKQRTLENLLEIFRGAREFWGSKIRRP